MQSVRVKIRGVAPMLQNRYPIEAESEETAKRRDQKFDPKEDAEKALHRNKNGCFVPSSWIEAALRDTAKEFKGIPGAGERRLAAHLEIRFSRLGGLPARQSSVHY